MPSYPLTFPTVHIEDVKVRRVFAGTRFDNPIDLTSQTQLRNAKRYAIDVTLQSMSRAQAASCGMAQFLDDLNGGFGSFYFNLTPWALGLTTPAGIRIFQLATNEHGWSADTAAFGFAFSAIEKL